MAVLDVIDYVTIATLGDATDFGNLSAGRHTMGQTSSATRWVYAGGSEVASVDTIEYVTIASTGNVTDFGNLAAARVSHQSGANGIRGITNMGGTIIAGGDDNVIQYITIASTGNSTDFGDLSSIRLGSAALAWHLAEVA